jgi:hypothetical protein
MQSWDDVSKLEQAQCVYWDMYKDAYSIRPRNIDTSNWTLEQFDAEFAYLEREIQQRLAEDAAMEKGAIQDFEARIGEIINLGAKTRETALRWIMDGSEAGGDWEYFCYLNGLPYGYFRQAA